jgi:hypothetical protein
MKCQQNPRGPFAASQCPFGSFEATDPRRQHGETVRRTFVIFELVPHSLCG